MSETNPPSPSFEEFNAMIKDHKKRLEFGKARELFDKNPPKILTLIQRIKLEQQRALCIYKDEELLPAVRFAEALKILETLGLRDPAKSGVPPKTLPETLALGGAVYKRMFEFNGQLENLHAALMFYRAAWKYDPDLDQGYGGVNAAYILDQLAFRAAAVAARSGTTSNEAAEFTTQAKALREDLATKLSSDTEAERKKVEDYWYCVTLAETEFGLQKFKEAGNWLAAAKQLNPDEWQLQTTFRQLASIARLQGFAPPDENLPREEWSAPWQALGKFFEGAACAFGCWRGKVGLALSGGGFRASLFHLGVLARLAEMDVLRSVEVLSTVSGGSIVGAHYYLAVRDHLQKNCDREIKREDYVQIVKEVRVQFLKGVQSNLRSRTLTNLICNFKTLAPCLFGVDSYTRSHRIGELYERYLYSEVKDEFPQKTERTMPSLLVEPKGENPGSNFKPKFSNWRRRARVPVLLLNTTSLNSGHTWHFTASWMGEPPGLLGQEMDANRRYRRLYYGEAPKDELKNYRLGHAVAASACVPGLFEPLTINGLYKEQVKGQTKEHTIRLVDGGVHDNQGLESLLDESCDFILCSDASGQMEDSPVPADGALGVSARSMSILQSRVREEGYQNMRARLDNGALKGLFFVHLKKGLTLETLDWIGCENKQKQLSVKPETDYGVDRDIQRKLAALRTDLDTFTEVEAYSLMLSGYLMTKHEFKQLNEQHKLEHPALAKLGEQWGQFDCDAKPELEMERPFDRLLDIVKKSPDSLDAQRKELGRQLTIGASLVFKVWRLCGPLRVSSWILGLVLAGFLLWGSIANWDSYIPLGFCKIGGLVIGAVLFVIGLIWPALKWLDPKRATRGWLVKISVVIFGWIAANIHVRLFDPLFRRFGKIDRLLNR
ncbi:MAG TPA: patatin-like phospholipase family protein [Verrucomicrobiae bacterium]|jgi:predicted acylesterase/phospholipase RssA|nr:patatin-like phospholipase family protein [Verrucomicrobiae bacterium]